MKEELLPYANTETEKEYEASHPSLNQTNLDIGIWHDFSGIYDLRRVAPFLKHLNLKDSIGKKALDTGCSQGFLVRALVRTSGLDAYGIDLQPDAIELAKARKIGSFAVEI